jgi:NAD(P)-dependent dehydrogenase (short-subunit alcohol dehydrogenase family)
MAHAAPGRGVDGRVAVVIGGTSGLGRAIALGLAEAGADVVATGRRTALVADVASEIESHGKRSLRVSCDVSNETQIQELLSACLDSFAQVDILVNAAGRVVRAPTLEMPDADWDELLEVNFRGTLRACRAFGRHMIERRYGRIINVASLTSLVGLHEVAAYSAGKAAVAALTRSLAVEWGRHGICVNALVPGVFRTAMNAGLLDGTARGRELLMRTPMGRFGEPEDVVGPAVFLASESARFVNGHLLAVDGGILASGVNQ